MVLMDNDQAVAIVLDLAEPLRSGGYDLAGSREAGRKRTSHGLQVSGTARKGIANGPGADCAKYQEGRPAGALHRSTHALSKFFHLRC